MTTILISLIFIIYGALLYALSGASLHVARKLGKKGESEKGVMPINLTWLPEALFALPIAIVGMMVLSSLITISWSLSLIIFPVYWFISYIGVQTGHAVILGWDNIETRDSKSRDNTLTPLVKLLAKGINKLFPKIVFETETEYKESFAWLFTFVKGTLIGLPLLYFAPLAGLAWMIGHEIGSHAKNFLAQNFYFDKDDVIGNHFGFEASAGAFLYLLLTLIIILV